MNEIEEKIKQLIDSLVFGVESDGNRLLAYTEIDGVRKYIGHDMDSWDDLPDKMRLIGLAILKEAKKNEK
jgi:hypothetical protein